VCQSIAKTSTNSHPNPPYRFRSNTGSCCSTRRTFVLFYTTRNTCVRVVRLSFNSWFPSLLIEIGCMRLDRVLKPALTFHSRGDTARRCTNPYAFRRQRVPRVLLLHTRALVGTTQSTHDVVTNEFVDLYSIRSYKIPESLHIY
jgi:hypothetical protein